MDITYLLLALLWFVYFSLHSLLARSRIKEMVRLSLPAVFPFYRLLYSLLALGGLGAVLYFNMMISGDRWFSPSTGVSFVALVLASWGVMIISMSFRQYSLREFLGLKRAAAGEEGLKTGGLLHYVRHPLYAGTILLVLGFWLYIPTTANLITTLSIIIYIFIGIQLEEKSLIRQYGEEYRAYKKRVPMLVPLIRSC